MLAPGHGVNSVKRIGSYEVRGVLGHGSTASVYECRHVALGRLAAVKMLHPHLAQHESAVVRFLREGRAISRIVHPNVVEVFDIGWQDGLPYLVMSLVEGIDLNKHLLQVQTMSLSDIVQCMVPVIRAVDAAHDAGVIHRDIKPSNIRLTRDHLGRRMPKVLDFGISKLLRDDQALELTETDHALGTASYMAPEQLRCPERVTVACDIYAVGVVLYECATGLRPFRGASTYDLMHAILTDQPSAPTSLRPDLPEAFDAIVLRAMRRDPTERFASARDFGDALASLPSDPASWGAESTRPIPDSVPPSSLSADSGAHSITMPSEAKVLTERAAIRGRSVG